MLMLVLLLLAERATTSTAAAAATAGAGAAAAAAAALLTRVAQTAGVIPQDRHCQAGSSRNHRMVELRTGVLRVHSTISGPTWWLSRLQW